MRRRVLNALVATSASPDAFPRLRAKLSMAQEIVRNTWLPEVPTLTAADVYTGALHQGLDLASLTPTERERANRLIVITSPLWGVVRPDDRIPPYRMDLISREDLAAILGERWPVSLAIPGEGSKSATLTLFAED